MSDKPKDNEEGSVMETGFDPITGADFWGDVEPTEKYPRDTVDKKSLLSENEGTHD